MTRFIGIVARWSWLILLLGAITGGVAFVVSQQQPRQYTAEAIVLVGSLTQTDLQQQLAYQQLAQTYATVALTTPVLDRVRSTLDLEDDVDDVRTRLVVSTDPDGALVVTKATAADPAGAASLANAVAAEVVGFAGPVAGTTLRAEVIQPAVEPSEPSSPNVLLNTVIAAAIGLVIGLGLAMALTEWRQSRRAPVAPPPWLGGGPPPY